MITPKVNAALARYFAKRRKATKPASFNLAIHLGNDAMRTRQDLASSLSEIRDDLLTNQDKGGTIYDLNGNLVGTWALDDQG